MKTSGGTRQRMPLRHKAVQRQSAQRTYEGDHHLRRGVGRDVAVADSQNLDSQATSASAFRCSRGSRRAASARTVVSAQ